MGTIGGYFELEVSKSGHQYHDTPYAAKSGRASLYHILSYIKPSLVYVPFYTCDTLMEPFAALDVKFEFYAVTEQLQPVVLPELADGECFLYVNYMGLQDETVSRLSEKYKDRLIADCTQAYFMKGNGVSWFFNSCRKFFGVPDGSYLYTPSGGVLQLPQERNERYVTEHLTKRLEGHANEGYPYFAQNEAIIGNGTTAMSQMTEALLAGVNYDDVMARRRENYNFLHSRLKYTNRFVAAISDAAIPMCYPYLPAHTVDKAALAAKDIFIPSFWKDVLQRNIDGYEIEKMISRELCPLPVDHRYTIADMELMYNTLTGLLQ